MIALALATLVAGLGATAFMGVRDRWALVPGLGLGLVVALFLLFGFWPAVALALLTGVGMLVRKPEPAPALRLGTLAALALLGAAAWLYPVGSMRLDPGFDFLVRQAPMAAMHGVHPLGPEAAPADAGTTRLLQALGGDPLFAAQVFAGVCGVLVLLTLFGGLRAATGHSLAGILGAGAMLAGTPTSWLATPGFDPAVTHLLAAALVGATLASVHAFTGALVVVLASALGSAAWPLVLMAALAPWVPGRDACRLERRAQTALAVLAAVALLLLGHSPTPAAYTATWWTWLLPVAVLTPSWSARVLALGEAGVMLFGGLEPGVLAAGSVFAAAGELLGAGWARTQPGHWGFRGGLSIPWRALASVAILFLVVQGFEPAETDLNRRVLLAGQKSGVSVGELFTPLTLQEWAPRHGARHGVRPTDLDVAEGLRGKAGEALVLTIGAEREPVVPSAVIATLARTPLAGWRYPDLEPAAEVAAWEAANQAAPGERLLVRLPQARWPAGSATGETFRGAWKGTPMPGSLVEIEVTPPPARGEVLGYHVLRDGEPFSRIPTETAAGRPLLFAVPRQPGEYRLSFFRRADGVETLLGEGGLPPVKVEEERFAVKAEGLAPRLPSRSLVPFTLVLQNPTTAPMSLHRFETLRLEIEGRDAYPEERAGRLQPLVTDRGRAPLLLPAGGEVRLQAVLPTPLTEGTFTARAVLVDEEGGEVALPWQAAFRTWRRLPPAGAW